MGSFTTTVKIPYDKNNSDLCIYLSSSVCCINGLLYRIKRGKAGCSQIILYMYLFLRPEDCGLAQWLERLAQDRKILGLSPSHAELPMLEWALHITSISN